MGIHVNLHVGKVGLAGPRFRGASGARRPLPARCHAQVLPLPRVRGRQSYLSKGI